MKFRYKAILRNLTPMWQWFIKLYLFHIWCLEWIMFNKNVFLTDVDYPSYSWFGFCVFSHLPKLTSHFLLDFSSSKRPRYTYGWPEKHKNLSEWRNTYVKHIYRPYYWSYWAHHYYQEFRQRAKAYLSWGWKTLQIN